MPLSKKQLVRLIRLVAQLKENRYPNCQTFAAAMQQADLDENQNLACTPKTIYRDIQLLKNDFSAPIKFDSARNGYYLTRRGWNFSCPQIFDDSCMLSAVLGARVAEHIFPDAMKQEIRNAVDFLLTHNNPAFLDKAQLDSLVVIPANRTKVDAKVFMPLFYAWQNHEVCRINYVDSRGKVSARDFEPHALAYFDGIWYTKGFCHERNEMRTLTLARIKAVVLTGKNFTPDQKIVKSVTEDDIFGADIIEKAVVKCDAYLAKIVPARPLHPEQKIVSLPNGECELHIPRIARYRLISWVMHQCGRAAVVQPQILQQEIILFADKIKQAQAETIISN